MKKSLIQKMLLLLTAAGLLPGALPATATLVSVTNDIAAGSTVTWYSTNEYLLNTVVYVQTNATLIIEPGTVVKGGTNSANLIARTGIPNLVSALWVTRGGKLYATGTVSAPITFTIEGDDVNDPNDIPPTVTGKWGGLVLMGRARVNSAFDLTGDAASPVFDVYEGVTDHGPNFEHRFGGNDDGDSSGALRYVSIRHTGSVFAPNKELNSLTMGGVGSNTVIEYVESYASSDDAFEWWGGCVNTKHLVAAFCEDDDFDTDQGYRGTNQFWFGIKGPWQGSSDSRGIESDGDTVQTIIGDRLPYSQWAVYNMTLIGRGTNNTSFGGGRAWNARDEAAPKVLNSVIASFNTGLLLDTDGLHHWTNTFLADARNNVWDVVTNANSTGLFVFTDASRTNEVTAALLGGISYTNDGVLDPRPTAGSPALNHVLAGAPVTANYRGAFADANDNWADGWSFISQAGYLKASLVKPVETITSDITGTKTWKSNFEYLLNTVVYVQTNATLIIEPGTVVKGGTNSANLIARTGIPNLVSALWVTRGGKLYATGTVSAPIIFTIEGDDVNNPNDIPPTVTGKWGGLVIMGRARVNSAFDLTGDAASPVFDVYEGVTDHGPNLEHRFGGNDDGDSSGALRYVSIRHTGSVFAPNKELNSLTMGGVGSNTVIEYVESYASSDDAFEWWGGCVNTKHLVAAFCEDDDFDTDQGYRGTNQFWFGIKGPWQGSSDSRGIESDGDVSQTIIGDRTPFSQWAVYNLTLIGRGTNNTSFGGGRAWNARDEAAPNVLNSVIAGFNTGLLLDTDGLHHFTNTFLADARNNVWDVAVNANSTGLFLFSDAGRTNQVTAALLGGISYTNDGVLDPRPQVGSPALTAALPGAPVPANYRGAFADTSDNWADGWSFISAAGYLKLASTCPTITVAPGTLPSGTASSNYSQTITASGGAAPYTFVVTSGSLPAGLTLATNGALTGTLTVVGTNNFTVTATDNNGCTGLKSYLVIIIPNKPALVSTHTGGNLDIVFATQTGGSYQLQSTTNLAATPIVWADEGGPVAGTGGSLTSTVPTAAGLKFFRMRAQ